MLTVSEETLMESKCFIEEFFEITEIILFYWQLNMITTKFLFKSQGKLSTLTLLHCVTSTLIHLLKNVICSNKNPFLIE